MKQDITPYDRRLVRKPYIALQADHKGAELFCEVLTKPSDPGPVKIRDLFSDMQADILPTGKLFIRNRGSLSQEGLDNMLLKTFGLVWQGDIPSSVKEHPHMLAHYIHFDDPTPNPVGTLDDLTVNVSRHLLAGLADIVEAALNGEDLGHPAATRALIAQAREIAGE